MQVTARNRLRELRKDRELKLFELASIVKRDQSVYARYEREDVQIPDDAKLALAAFYGVTVEYLMGWDREQAA